MPHLTWLQAATRILLQLSPLDSLRSINTSRSMTELRNVLWKTTNLLPLDSLGLLILQPTCFSTAPEVVTCCCRSGTNSYLTPGNLPLGLS